MSSPKKVLIIRFSSLGDVIQVMAVAGYVRRLYPQAEIHWLTKAAYGDLVAACPAVDRVWAYDSRHQGLKDFCRQIDALNFDLLVDCHAVWRSLLARQYIGAGQKLVYHKPYWRRWLLFHLHHDTFAKDFHVIGDYCALLGQPQPRPLSQLVIKPELNVWAQNVLDKSHSGQQHWLACIIGAAWPQKRYPVPLWQQLLTALLASWPGNLLLIGGPGDKEVEQIAAALPKERVKIANNYSVMETLALIAGCRTALGNDTGFMHGAEALGKDVIFLLGPTSRHGGGYPNRPGSVAMEVTLSCRPCSQKGDRRCKRPCPECFYQLDQGRIIDELMSRLA